MNQEEVVCLILTKEILFHFPMDFKDKATVQTSKSTPVFLGRKSLIQELHIQTFPANTCNAP